MRIAQIETLVLDEGPLPNLVFVRIHTDEGIVGTGETCYAPKATQQFVHEIAAPMLLECDPLAIETCWNLLYGTCAKFGAKGLEMRAISAIDVALWDILGQAAGMPIYQVLGGAARESVPIYNTCGGPSYGGQRMTRPGYGSAERTGQWDDLHAFRTDAGALAADLLSEGTRGMKIWPFDQIAHRTGGRLISPREIADGLEPIQKIRDAVGDEMEIMLEGHGFWSVTAAQRIALAVEPYRPAWLEDFVLADNVDGLAELRRSTSTPIAASEYLMTRSEYRALIEREAADYVMVDPTWAGGITESRKIASMAEAHGNLVTMHDCTGPLTLLAGTHLALNVPNIAYQETVRAHIRVLYDQLVTDIPVIKDGHILPPSGPGIGTTLLPELFTRADATVQRSGRRTV